MNRRRAVYATGLAALGLLVAAVGCRNHMPHAFTWANTGDTVYTHPKPPEGGYWSNWDPYAVELELTPLEDINPVRTQHVMVATVRDKNGKPLPNRRVEWIISEGSVGDIVEVDESGWRASRGYKVDNHFAVSHTNNFKHVLDRGNDDPSDDVMLEKGQTFCVITSPVEGTTYVTAYAPGIYDWNKHKVFAVKHWYDVKYECPPPATNPVGTTHEFVTRVSKYSDNSALSGYMVTYKILDGPAATLEPGGSTVATVPTDADGNARVTIRQSSPAEGTNNLSIEIIRPENVQCCKPAVRIGECPTSKTWVGPKIAIDKSCTPSALVGDQVNYTITVTNPSAVDATNVVVTDTLPAGIEFVSASPSGNGSWSLGTLPGGASSTINIVGRATRTGTFENCAEVRADFNLQARACCTTVVTAPALALEKRCPSAVTVCDPIPYTIIVRNTGDGVAKNVVVTDTLPNGVTTADGQTAVTANVGDLGPGQAKEITFQGKASGPGTYTNPARATADGGLTAEATCTTVVTKPTISVTKTAPPKRMIGRGSQRADDFTITVTNNGDVPATDVVLTDELPASQSFVSASDGGTASGTIVTWRLGTLEPGASRTVTVSVRTTAVGSSRNVAKVTAFCADAMVEAMHEVEAVPAILLECVDDPDPIELGGTVTYTITVTNQGMAVGTNIKVNCTIQPEGEFVSAGGVTNGSVSGKAVSFEPYPSLAPGARISWTVVVKANQVGDTRFSIEMTSAELTGPAVLETEATRFYE